MRASAGGGYDHGYHVVWCPGYRRVLTGLVAVRREELIRARCDEHGWRDLPSYIASQLKGFTSRTLGEEIPSLRSRLPTLWFGSLFVATVGAVSAATARRYLDTQYERPWLKGGPS
ncbi:MULTISPECIES: transposase [Micromonospora]|uniref:transposase n=1 Tax=Micromonospora TaxID=1873 RepID=UPI001EEFDD11|nr:MULTISPECIES: transposase [unclassified Micromonospora]